MSKKQDPRMAMSALMNLRNRVAEATTALEAAEAAAETEIAAATERAQVRVDSRAAELARFAGELEAAEAAAANLTEAERAAGTAALDQHRAAQPKNRFDRAAV